MIYRKSKQVLDYEDAAMGLMFTKMVFGAKEYQRRKLEVFREKNI